MSYGIRTMSNQKKLTISFIIPTKNRPENLRKCLQGLADQNEHVQKVIVVATGEDVQDVVKSFIHTLKVQYIYSETSGQIYQRNLGIDALDKDAELVGFFDDDVVLQEKALSNILNFISYRYENNDKLIGVGFNIINKSSSDDDEAGSIKKKLIYLFHSNEQGKVTKSGLNTSIWNVKNDIQTQWLGGGYTIWVKQILEEFKQSEIATNWAIGEDLRFSYKIGKKYNLYICASAKIIDDGANSIYNTYYHDYKKTISQLIFIYNHNEFSYSRYFCYVVGLIVFNILSFNKKKIKGSIGIIFAILKFSYYRLSKQNKIEQLLSD